jgi:type IV secretion system protein VirD4
VQQRWRYADDELAPGASLSIEALAYDLSQLPDLADMPPERVAETVIDFLDGGRPGRARTGGAIEAAADADGILIADQATVERAELT